MEEKYLGMKTSNVIGGKNVLMVPVHIGGHVNPDVLRMSRDATVLEDCAHAFGSSTVRFGREYFAGKLGLAGVFSFFALFAKQERNRVGGRIGCHEMELSCRGMYTMFHFIDRNCIKRAILKRIFRWQISFALITYVYRFSETSEQIG